MVRRRRVQAAALLWLVPPLAASLGLRTAVAQTAPFSLSWDAPAECPAESAVRRSVEQLLGGGPPPPVPVSARAVVEHPASGRWNVRITTVRGGASGERVVESQSCQSLADATALIVALTIDPERVAARTPPSSSTATASESAAPPPPPVESSPSASASGTVPPLQPQPQTQPPPRAPATGAPVPAAPVATAHEQDAVAWMPPTSRPNLFALFAQVGVDVGTLPRTALAVGAGAALTLGNARLEGYGTYLPPQAASDPALASLGTDLHLLAGGVRGCFLPLHGLIEAGGCAGIELGDLHGQGFQSRTSAYFSFTPADAGGFWIAATLSGRASWRVARAFALALDLGLLVPFRRDEFDIEQVVDPAGDIVYHQLHQAGPVEGRATIGPEVRF